MTDPTTSVSTPGRVEPVDYTVDDGLATITLQRPESRNALDTVTKEALRAAVDEAAGDPGVRAVLLTGSGQAFCVGQDLHEHVRRLADLTLDEVWSTVEEHYAPLAMALATMRAWNAFRCWVSEFTAVPELDANAGAIAFETVVLQNEGFVRDSAVVEVKES